MASEINQKEIVITPNVCTNGKLLFNKIAEAKTIQPLANILNVVAPTYL